MMSPTGLMLVTLFGILNVKLPPCQMGELGSFSNPWFISWTNPFKLTSFRYFPVVLEYQYGRESLSFVNARRGSSSA
jgi:hypothetical protein